MLATGPRAGRLEKPEAKTTAYAVVASIAND
jgi:mono/diheme cytochrome c family protein